MFAKITKTWIESFYLCIIILTKPYDYSIVFKAGSDSDIFGASSTHLILPRRRSFSSLRATIISCLSWNWKVYTFSRGRFIQFFFVVDSVLGSLALFSAVIYYNYYCMLMYRLFHVGFLCFLHEIAPILVEFETMIRWSIWVRTYLGYRVGTSLNLLLETFIQLLPVFSDVLELGPRGGGRDVPRGETQDRLHLEAARARRFQLRTQVVDFG